MSRRRTDVPSQVDRDYCYLEGVDHAGTYWQRLLPDLMIGVVELRGELDEDWNDFSQMIANYGADNVVIGERVSRWKPKPVRVATTFDVVYAAFAGDPNPLDPIVGSSAAPENPRAFNADGDLLWSLYSGGGVVSVYPASQVYERVLADVHAARALGGVVRGGRCVFSNWDSLRPH